MDAELAQEKTARALTPDESHRLDVLCDTGRILRALYYQPCKDAPDDHSFMTCSKCEWLLRALDRVEREQKALGDIMMPDRSQAGA